MIRDAVACLGKLFGEDWSVDVVSVDLARSSVTDAGLMRLPEPREVESLCLSKTQLTYAGLAHLRDPPEPGDRGGR
jgi:hypothetical protein